MPSLETQDELLNPRGNPSRSAHFETNTKAATSTGESHVDDVPEDDDDWYFEGVAGLDEVERVGIE